jgi:hypothetical protein
MTAIQAIPTRDELADRNFAHAERLVPDVALVLDLPEDAVVLFYPEADPFLAGYNLALAHARRDQGKAVYLVPVAPDGTLAAPQPLGEVAP